jgi:flagellar biosynthesis/type III secretory pathway ATPase
MIKKELNRKPLLIRKSKISDSDTVTVQYWDISLEHSQGRRRDLKELQKLKRIGKIIQIIGPVVDISFTSVEDLPNIYDALTTTDQQKTFKTFEVQQILGDNVVRAISINATDGLVRGREVLNTQNPLEVPVGRVTLGRIFNALGDAVDGSADVPLTCERLPIHRLAPPFVNWIQDFLFSKLALK